MLIMIKAMPKQKQASQLISLFARLSISAVAIVTALALSFGTPLISAITVQQQINQLQQENAQNEQAVEKLEDQALNYQDAIDKLAAKISNLQAKIDDNNKTQEELKERIQEAQQELDRLKEILGENIKAMYLEGDISTLEMLASSRDLSEYVDKQQYRNSVQDRITETLEKIIILKNELRTKKTAIDELLKEQNEQKAELANSRDKQHSLLSYNEAQQEEFNKETKNNQQRIDELVASQRSANISTDGGYYFLRFPGTVKSFSPGNYPWRNAGFSMQLGPCSYTDSWPDYPDGWGYCTRQCVSYAAWAVGASGRSIPYFYGSARFWVGAAISHGISVSRSPQPGDIAISTSGYWGHAMYVESVSGNHFTTSEYNTYLDGRLHYMTRSY